MSSNWPMQFMAGLYGVKLEDPKARERAEALAREEAERADVERSRSIVVAFNEWVQEQRGPLFFPTVRAALLAQAPILEALCTGCQTIGQVDLRKIDIHPTASVSALIPRLSCKRCCPHAPFAVIVGLQPDRGQKLTAATYEAMLRARREHR